MEGGTAPRQQQRVIFRTRDAEEARAFLSAREFRLDLSRGEAPHLDLRIDGIFLPSLYLGRLQYGAAVEIRTSALCDDYRLALPLRGSLEALIGSDDVAAKPGRAMLISPTLSNVVRTERGSVGLSIFFRGPALRCELAALLGEPPKAPLELAPLVDITTGYGNSLAQYLRVAMDDLDWSAPLSNPITTRLFEQFVMIGLLLAHPHNYSGALRRPQRWIAPGDVRRAVDFIEANLDEPIGLAEIVAASGIAARTLSLHFRRFCGTTPMRYLRRARLARVHEALQHAEPEEGVTAIAMNWGFVHMGRFSAEYRRAFGELPSETLGNYLPIDRS